MCFERLLSELSRHGQEPHLQIWNRPEILLFDLLLQDLVQISHFECRYYWPCQISSLLLGFAFRLATQSLWRRRSTLLVHQKWTRLSGAAYSSDSSHTSLEREVSCALCRLETLRWLFLPLQAYAEELFLDAGLSRLQGVSLSCRLEIWSECACLTQSASALSRKAAGIQRCLLCESQVQAWLQSRILDCCAAPQLSCSLWETCPAQSRLPTH